MKYSALEASIASEDSLTDNENSSSASPVKIETYK